MLREHIYNFVTKFVSDYHNKHVYYSRKYILAEQIFQLCEYELYLFDTFYYNHPDVLDMKEIFMSKLSTFVIDRIIYVCETDCFGPNTLLDKWYNRQ